MSFFCFDNKKFTSYCLKQKLFIRDDVERYLQLEKLPDELLPTYLLKAEEIIKSQRLVNRRIQEGVFISSVGLLGIAYSYTKKVDGTVWVIWSVLGLGVLTLGLFKKRRNKKNNYII